jgi:hypothetical protein
MKMYNKRRQNYVRHFGINNISLAFQQNGNWVYESTSAYCDNTDIVS